MDLFFFFGLPFRLRFGRIIFDLLEIAKAVEQGILEVVRWLFVLFVP